MRSISFRRSRLVCTLALIVLGTLASPAWAQGLTGQIGGTVLDTQKAAVPGATVSVRNTSTQVARETVTDAQGAFVITNLLAGTYDLKVTLASFKTYEQKGVVVTATERVALPPIALELGGLSEAVSVQAEALRVQTQSGERSATISAQQIQDIGLKGRDFMGSLQLLPGVIDTRNRDAPGWGSVGNMTINGQSSFNFSYDGVTNKDTGSNSGNYAAPALDSIAEVKVQASNFQAEYGRSSGATITVVTKSGGRNFHGSLAYYKRDERFNANAWDRQDQCDAAPIVNGAPNANCSKPRYRYDNTAWTIGGPVVLPGVKFNRDRNKLFFFWSQDLLPRTDPGDLLQSTMPTALERMGDFSQTVNTSGQRIWIKDPLLAAQGLACNVNSGGPGCFANNVIPANRIDHYGAMMLNLFPMPNTTDPTGRRQYNYVYQNVLDKPKNDQVLRVDYNARDGTTFYSRVQFGNEVNSRGYNGFLGAGTGNGGNASWPQFNTSYEIKTVSLVNTLLHTLSPTSVLEVTYGINWAQQSVDWMSQETLDQNNRAIVLDNLPQFFPEANPLNLIPNMSFGGTNALPNTRGIGISNRFPFNAKNITSDYSANLTKLKGSHNMKAGIFIEHTARPAPRAAVFNGTYDFNANTSNPFDTNFGFANALLGSINAYTESTAKPFAQGRFNQVEFFAQDNWRINRKFTADYGMRFYYLGPTYVKNQDIAYFDPTSWAGGSAPLLFEPVCANGAATCAGTTRVARNPLTGEIVNNTYIDKLVPGSGDFYNGMNIVKQTVYDGKGILFAPRAGFAWDVAGDGRTAVRGGVGIFYDRYSDDIILSLTEQPPLIDTRTTTFTTVPQLLGSQLVQSPRGVTAFAPFEVPTVYNWSLGVQRELPFKMVADVSYVGNANRHSANTVQINNVPYGTTRVDLNPQNADPTQNNTVAYPTDYLRDYRGFGGIGRQEWRGYANYHSIQVSVQRRFENGFGWGLAYTGSRRRSIGTFDPFLSEADNLARNYTLNGSRPHVLTINYNWDVPGLGRVWDNPIVKGVTDGWQISGISQFLSGTHSGFSYSFSGAPFNDMTGGGLGGPRVTLVCDPNLPRGERTQDRQFRTECIQPGGPTTNASDIYYLGTSTNDEWISPGYMNHDITIFKNFAMPNRRNLQVRIEMYNAFNAKQYGNVDTGAQFNFATGEQTDTGFGSVTSSRTASYRIIQLALRFTF
ncbi:MAG TPA: carboxypeptidase regulatory-like domain-containing protein [Vicinamibacterales bacterium]|nr:carboxypeptidase regulatory-like domain-containing protein [Vicinamibacterales bacterium]